jgi:protein SCO1/2
MRSIRPALLLIIATFAAGFAVALVIAFEPKSPQAEGKALIGGPFSLVDTDGKRVTDEDFRGKLMLVLFGYTHCPDVCPTELQTIADVLTRLGPDAGKVVPIFVSVDPKRDTREILSNYVKNFDPHIVGLTGSESDVASAAKAYRVYFRKSGDGSSGDDYNVDHSAFIYLMDQEGNYLTHFSFNTATEVMVDVIKKHALADKSS